METPNRKEGLKGLCRRHFGSFSPEHLFILSVLAFSLFCFFYYILRRDVAFEEMFFNSGNDLFMDFFNSIRDASKGPGVYTERGVIYPPMANLFFWLFSFLLPADYTATEFWARRMWIEVPSAYLLIFLFFFLLFFFLYAVLRENTKGTRATAICFAAAAVLSYPTVYCLERGNVIVLAVVALLIYAVTYRSNSPAARELGLVMLAFSFSLKLYPVIFGYFLLTDRRFKEALRCVIYGLLMLLVPSLPFGGPKGIFVMVGNVLGFSSSGGSGNPSSAAAKFLGVSETLLSAVFLFWCLVCLAVFLLSVRVFKDRPFKQWLAGCMLILSVPSLTGVYNFLFVIIAYFVLVNDKSARSRTDWMYAALMTVAFLPVPKIYYASTGLVLAYVMTGVLSVCLAAETVAGLVRMRKDRTKAPPAADTFSVESSIENEPRT